MAGKHAEPPVITDYRQEPVCILPAGFQLDDARREHIRAHSEAKGASPTHDDLRDMFSDEPALNKKHL